MTYSSTPAGPWAGKNRKSNPLFLLGTKRKKEGKEGTRRGLLLRKGSGKKQLTMTSAGSREGIFKRPPGDREKKKIRRKKNDPSRMAQLEEKRRSKRPSTNLY